MSSWMIPSLPWLGWLILGLVPPAIFILYFLKLKRTPLVVPSTYLWTKTVEDMHVNSIWQRLRNNLLLWLQLALAFLLLGACLRPGCAGEELAGERFIFLIDSSASMSATDVLESTNTRLEEAKDQVANMLDRMKPSDVAMVISFSDRAIVQQSYTKNKSLLKRKVRQIKQTERGSDLNEALLAASGLANPGRTSDRNSSSDIQVADALEAVLYVFSDGGVKEIPSFNMGNLTPEYHPMGRPSIDPALNIGITAFAVNTGENSKSDVQAFARLINSGTEETTVGVSLYVNNELFDSDGSVTVKAGGSTSLAFDLSGQMRGLEEPVPVRLEIDQKDIYMQDNVAYGVLNPPRLAHVLVVTEYNKALKLALNTPPVKKLALVEFEGPDFLKEKQYVENSTLGVYDLVIYDQCTPEKMPLCNTLFLGATPPIESWKAAEERGPSPILDFDTTHPLFFAVSMSNVLILNGKALEGPPGSTTLLESDYGDLIVLGPRGGFEDLVISFPLSTFSDTGEESVNTDWPNNLSFPIFTQNVMSHLAGGASFDEAKGTAPGSLVKIKTQFPAEEILIETPEKRKEVVQPRGDGSFVYGQTNKSGVYAVTNQSTKELDQLLAINLFDGRESDMKVRDELEIGYEKVAGSRETQPARKEFWTWILLGALLVLMVEWVIYNKRVFI